MRKILVVDDNPSFRELVEMVFNNDYRVRSAADGREGVKIAADFLPDLILMDIMMPNIGGVEMLRLLQADMDTRAIPVLILSATHFDESTKMMFQQEPNVRGFLSKPCAIDDLREQIYAVIGPPSQD